MHVINAPAQESAQQQAKGYNHSSGNGRMAGSVPRYDTTPSHKATPQMRSQSFANQLRGASPGSQPEQGQDGGFGLDSLVDAVNPLHHLPVVGTIYREVTGDELGPVARVAGGALYGGAVGAALSAGNAALEYASGEDIAGHAMAMLDGGDGSRGPAHSQGVSPESRIENAIAAYGSPAVLEQDEQTTYTTARAETSQPAHIRQSSYNA